MQAKTQPLKAKPEDYRLVVFRTLCKTFKVCKSFIQQKLASKVKKFSHLSQKDPSNDKFRKSFQKFERKLQAIKSLNAQAVKAAAFVYAKFDLNLNFDPLRERVEEVLERDVEELVAEVFAQVEKTDGEKAAFLKLYEHIKEKPQKAFKEAKEKVTKLIGHVKHKKETQKIKKKSREQRKLEAKKASEDDGEGSEGEGEGEADGDSQLSAVEGEEETQDPVHLKMKSKLADEVDKIIQKNAFFPRNREKKEAKPARQDFPHKNDRRKRIEKRGTKGKGAGRPQGPTPQADPGFHPSYAAKLATRTAQKNKNFSGEVVEL